MAPTTASSSPRQHRYATLSGHSPLPLAKRQRRVSWGRSADEFPPVRPFDSALPHAAITPPTDSNGGNTDVGTSFVNGFHFPSRAEDLRPSNATAGPSALPDNLYTFDDDNSDSEDDEFEEKPDSDQLELRTNHVSAPSNGKAPVRGGSTEEAIERQSHANRLALESRMDSKKGTEVAYARRQRDYEKFWADPKLTGGIVAPAQPITVSKVALFLQYETTRTKRTSDGQEIPGSSLGQRSISQAINALERYRYRHQHEDIYKNYPESHQPLRSDIRITTFESASKANEPQRIADAQALKAIGISSDTFTEDELIRCAMWNILACGKGKKKVFEGVRDRTMLLISTSTAFRGDNTRRLLWSDLGARDISMVDIGPAAKTMALILLTNQGKNNTTGRVDEQGAFRHRITELCSVGAVGFYFFTYFHVLERAVPSFVPDYSQGGGEMGRRPWYKLHLFFGGDGEETQMSYGNHLKRTNTMKKSNDVNISKATHAGRGFLAVYVKEHRASAEDIRDVGVWSYSGSYKTYEHGLPLDGMVAAASFNGRDQRSYMVPRDILKPPQELTKLLFPWVEAEQFAYKKRRDSLGKIGEDAALKNFLNLLIRLRRIILQDAAVLFVRYPTSPLFAFPPFTTPLFRTWAATSTSTIEAAEQEARHQLSALPEKMLTSMTGIVTTHAIQQQQARDEIRQLQEDMNHRFETMQALFQASLAQGSRKRRRGADTDYLPPVVSELERPYTAAATSSLVPPPQPLVERGNNHSTSNAGHAASYPPVATTSASSQSSVTVTPPAAAISLTGLSTVSRNGNIYSSTTFQLSTNDYERSKQLDAIHLLEKKFPVERLRQHEFEWSKTKSQNQDDEWLPLYAWWKPREVNAQATIEDIWTEHVHGMDGRLSVQQLISGWDARWKRNKSGLKVEGTRRRKVITLIETLSSRTNWNYSRALRFLKVKFPIPTPADKDLKTTRAFTDAIQRRDGVFWALIMEAADSYTS